MSFSMALTFYLPLVNQFESSKMSFVRSDRLSSCQYLGLKLGSLCGFSHAQVFYQGVYLTASCARYLVVIDLVWPTYLPSLA